MTLILMASLAIVFCLIFFGSFFGFAINEMSGNPYLLVVGLLIPGAVLGYLLQNALAFVLFGFSYLCGMVVGEMLRGSR